MVRCDSNSDQFKVSLHFSDGYFLEWAAFII